MGSGPGRRRWRAARSAGRGRPARRARTARARSRRGGQDTTAGGRAVGVALHRRGRIRACSRRACGSSGVTTSRRRSCCSSATKGGSASPGRRRPPGPGCGTGRCRPIRRRVRRHRAPSPRCSSRTPGADVPFEGLLEVYAEQQRRHAAAEHPGRMRLLTASESAGMLVAAEMHRAGLPWRADVHREVLSELLGERYRGRGRAAAAGRAGGRGVGGVRAAGQARPARGCGEGLRAGRASR